MSTDQPKGTEAAAAEVDEVRAALNEPIEIQVGGRTIRVRELTWLEGLELQAEAPELISEMSAAVAKNAPVSALEGLIVRHRAALLNVMAKACGADLDWLSTLPDADGMMLMYAWWQANTYFFARRLWALNQAVQAGEEKGGAASPSTGS